MTKRATILNHFEKCEDGGNIVAKISLSTGGFEYFCSLAAAKTRLEELVTKYGYAK